MNEKTQQNLKDIIASSGVVSKQDFRAKIVEFSKIIGSHPDSVNRQSFKENDAIDTHNGSKLEHKFADGTYIRTITMPKNMIIMSAIHLIEHPFFVMKGSATVISDEGIQLIEAPYQGITKPGTQRVLYIHEECVWTTVHATNKSKVEDVVEDVIAKDYNHPILKLNN